MPKVVRGTEKMRAKSYKLHPRTIEMINKLAKEGGMTQAEVIDNGLKLLVCKRNDCIKN